MPYTKSNVLRLLIVLGKNGALNKPTIIKTTDLKDILNVSQQTISRWLEELNESNYISKEQTNRGLKIQILDKANNEILLPAYTDLQKIYHLLPNQIRGELTEGLGEGGYYISLEGYKVQFKRILGWIPYAGTLNLRLATVDDVEDFQRLIKSPYILIDGFIDEKNNRSLGKVFLWPCTIQHNNQEIEGAIIYPDRTHHSPRQIIEIISPKFIRDSLNLHDGDVVIVKPLPVS